MSGSKYSTQPPASCTCRLRCDKTLREYAVGTTCGRERTIRYAAEYCLGVWRVLREWRVTAGEHAVV